MNRGQQFLAALFHCFRPLWQGLKSIWNARSVRSSGASRNQIVTRGISRNFESLQCKRNVTSKVDERSSISWEFRKRRGHSVRVTGWYSLFDSKSAIGGKPYSAGKPLIGFGSGVTRIDCSWPFLAPLYIAIQHVFLTILRGRDFVTDHSYISFELA